MSASYCYFQEIAGVEDVNSSIQKKRGELVSQHVEAGTATSLSSAAYVVYGWTRTSDAGGIAA